VDPSDVLRLEVRHFQDAANWEWALTDAAGRFVASHRVRLDPADQEYQAMTQLPVQVRWQADPGRLLASQADFLDQIGRWMGERIFGDIGRKLVERSPATVLIVVPAEAEILRHWPLELARIGRKPLALSEVSLVIDAGGGDAAHPKQPIGDRLRMLAVFSLPRDEPLLMLSQQRYELVGSVERLVASKASNINLVTLQYGVTRRRLSEILEEGEGWDVIHFSGHGLATGLLLEGANGRPDEVGADELITMLRLAHSRLKLLVLSSCESGAAAADAGLGSPSPDDEIPVRLPAMAADAARRLDCAVLGMRYGVGDDFSIELACHLYDSLFAKGNRLPRALQLALPKALERCPEPGNPALSVATPALFGQRAVDMRLTPPAEENPTFRPGGKMSRFVPQPDPFVGRVEVMAAAAQALAADNRFSGLLFHGSAAVGKTACALELAYLYRDQFSALVRYQAPAVGEPVAGSLTRLASAMESQLRDFGPGLREAIGSRAALDQFLPDLTDLMVRRSIFMLFEGMETLLTPEGTWYDEMWGALLNALLSHGHGSRLVLTSQMPLATPHDRLQVVPVPVLSPSESLLLARQLPHLGAVLRGRTELSVDWAVPLIADVLAAAAGRPVLIHEADRMLTSPSLLDRLPGQIAELTPGSLTASDRQLYLTLARRWTRGITLSPPEPATSAVDLTGLCEQDIRLLQASVTALQDLSDKLARLDRTPLRWADSDEVSVSTRRALHRADEQLDELKQQITVMTWPHAGWAAKLVGVRAAVQRDIGHVRDRTTPAGQAETARLGVSVAELLRWFHGQYPSLFTGDTAAVTLPPPGAGAYGELPLADPADRRPLDEVPAVKGTAMAFPGEVKLAFCQRVGRDWEALADLFDVPGYERQRFDAGSEPRDLWEWLENREKLGELPGGLERIRRGDLAAMMRPSGP
jgi:hypothetical protein